MTQNLKRGRDEDGGVFDQPDYVAAVKAGQRSSHNFKQAWHMYCESQNQTFYDPARHDNAFVQGFFDQLGIGYIQMIKGGSPVQRPPSGGPTPPFQPQRNSGPPNFLNQGPNNFQRPDSPHGGPMNHKGGMGMKGAGKNGNFNPGVPDGTPLARIQQLVKMGQRSSAEWKQLWIDWCQQNGNGVQDPARHSSLFILSFVLRFGLAQVVGTQWAQPYLVSLGELAKPFMTATITRGCQESEPWQDLWSTFADGKGPNLREPSKHDAGSLMEFFDMTAMVQFQNEPWMQCYQTGNESDHARTTSGAMF